MIVFAHDYETTGVNPKKCGVVQAALCFAKVYDDGAYEILTKDVALLYPGEPIPDGASSIHGIYDHHVEDCPAYEAYLAEQYAVVNTTEIERVAGFNSKRYDDVIAQRLGLQMRPALDLYVAANRFKTLGLQEKANLGETYRSLTGREPENAHDAFADIVMTLDLIKPAMQRAEVATLQEFADWLDNPWGHPGMKMKFGKHKGKKLCNLPHSYLEWALENLSSLDDDMRAGMQQVLAC